jgi:hypothetical protein
LQSILGLEGSALADLLASDQLRTFTAPHSLPEIDLFHLVRRWIDDHPSQVWVVGGRGDGLFEKYLN